MGHPFETALGGEGHASNSIYLNCTQGKQDGNTECFVPS